MARSLGQHFLTNRFYLNKIVDSLNVKGSDFVVEIGPGHGELTEVLAFRLQVLGKNWKLITIEKDIKLVKFLKEKFSPDKNIEVVYGDALKILPSITKTQNLTPKTYKLIGNLPYYITGYLLRILGELEPKPKTIVFTIQKEVAQRIIAQPPKMNLLAASVQFWAKPEIIGYIPKTAFSPQPKVDSAIIKLVPIPYALSPKPYYRLIKILFKQPRKTILNNLINIKRADLPKIDINIWRLNLQELLKKTGINPNDRPQNLSIVKISQMSYYLEVPIIMMVPKAGMAPHSQQP